MRSIVVIFLLFVFAQCSTAQNLLSGTYRNPKTEEFLIISDDSICFKLKTSEGLSSNCFGIGTYNYADELLSIIVDNTICYETSAILSNERADSLFSLRIVDVNDKPIKYGSVKIWHGELSDKSNCVFRKWHKQQNHNKVMEVGCVTDENGFVDEEILAPFLNSVTCLEVSSVGIEMMKQNFLVRKGFDYIIKSTIQRGDFACKSKRMEIRVTIMPNGSLKYVPLFSEESGHEESSVFLRISNNEEIDLHRFVY